MPSSPVLIRTSQSSVINSETHLIKNHSENHMNHTRQSTFQRFDYVYSIYSKLIIYILYQLQEFVLFITRFYQSKLESFQKYKKQLYQYESIKYYDCPIRRISLSRLTVIQRKILVLDLDETLIHSDFDTAAHNSIVRPNVSADFIVRVEVQKHPVKFYVYKRPHVDYFLEIVSQWYELVIFTASMEIYGAAVIDKLDDGRNLFTNCYYRQHCTFEEDSYSKDLSAVNVDLSRVLIVDNSPAAYRHYPWNAIPIKSWFFDNKDDCLLSLLPFLDALRFCKDVRSVLARNLHLHQNCLVTTSNSVITQVVPSPVTY